MKTILVPTDLSSLGDNALQFAVDLARQMDSSKIVLLNIIIPVHSDAFTASADVTKLQGSTADRFNLELMRRNEERVHERARNFKDRFNHIEAYVRFGESRTDLNHFVEEFKADLVVTGSESLGAFSELLFGSQEEKIIRKSHVPVITVKKEPGNEVIRNIVLAVDIEEEDLEGIESISNFAESAGALLHMVYVITDKDMTTRYAVDKLDSIAHQYHLKNFTINTVSNTDIEEGIRNFARKKGADLIAVFTEGKGKLHDLIFGNMAHELVRDTDLPVLVSKLHGE